MRSEINQGAEAVRRDTNRKCQGAPATVLTFTNYLTLHPSPVLCQALCQPRMRLSQRIFTATLEDVVKI